LWREVFDKNSPTREQARGDLLKIAQFAGIVPREGLEYERDFYPAMMSALFNSNSWIAIVMITDLLARKDRFNVPGTAAATNWTRRLPKTISQMHKSPSVCRKTRLIRKMLEKSGRARAIRHPERSEGPRENRLR
jgi:4-alpha-glucanotransferase